jgi:hypothetical protein
MNHRFDSVEVDIGLLKSAVRAHGHQLGELRAALDRQSERD